MYPDQESSSNLSPASETKLKLVHPSLVSLVRVVSLKIPIRVLEGHRDELDQHLAFEAGASKLDWPASRHNSLPSMAVDICPLPYDPKNIKFLYYFGGLVCGVAQTMGIPIVWGADWHGDHDFAHNGLQDFYHFELKPA